MADVIGPADPKASESGEVSVIADFAADTLVPHANRIDQRESGARTPDELARNRSVGPALPDRTWGSDAGPRNRSGSN